jgi:transcriptional regulator with XRE-family HTH domain
MKTPHAVLREMRLEVGLSADELAKRAGISVSRYSRIESGVDTPTRDDIHYLASALSGCAAEAKERLQTVSGAGFRESVGS